MTVSGSRSLKLSLISLSQNQAIMVQVPTIAEIAVSVVDPDFVAACQGCEPVLAGGQSK